MYTYFIYVRTYYYIIWWDLVILYLKPHLSSMQYILYTPNNTIKLI